VYELYGKAMNGLNAVCDSGGRWPIWHKMVDMKWLVFSLESGNSAQDVGNGSLGCVIVYLLF